MLVFPYNGILVTLPMWLSDKESTHQARDVVQSLGRGYPPEKKMATHPSILAWEIPWTEEPGGIVHRVAEVDTTE